MRGWPQVIVEHGGMLASFQPELKRVSLTPAFEEMADAACRAALMPWPWLEKTHQSNKNHLQELKRKVEATAHKIDKDAETLAVLKETQG